MGRGPRGCDPWAGPALVCTRAGGAAPHGEAAVPLYPGLPDTSHKQQRLPGPGPCRGRFGGRPPSSQCPDLPAPHRAAGTAGGRPVRPAAAAMRRATAAPSASTRTGRSTTTCVARACRAPPLPWLTRCPGSRTSPPAPVKLAPQGPLAQAPPGHLALWMPLCPADPSRP